MLQQVVAEGPLSRADISRATGLTPATVSDLVGELVGEGLVSELGFGPSAGGKPPTLVGLKASARSVVAIDLSDGGQVGSVVDLAGNAAYRTRPWRPGGMGQERLDQVIEDLEELVEAAPSPVLGIGVGTPGVIDTDGTVVEASNLGWHDLPLGEILSEHFDRPVHVVNNSRAAALAEYSFGGHEAENLFVVKIGYGIGAGVLLDGRIHTGEAAASGEIGHVVVDPQGPLCRCGRTGCLETVSGVQYLIGEASVDGSTQEILADLAQRAASGDSAARRRLGSAARHLGQVLATTVAVLDVHHVILTGLIASLGESFLRLVGEEIKGHVLPALADKLELHYGQTGDRAVRLGAAALVLSNELGVM